MKRIILIKEVGCWANVYIDDVFYRAFYDCREYIDNKLEVLNYFRQEGDLKQLDTDKYEFIPHRDKSFIEVLEEEKSIMFKVLDFYKKDVHERLESIKTNESLNENIKKMKVYEKELEIIDSCIEKLIESNIRSFKR